MPENESWGSKHFTTLPTTEDTRRRFPIQTHCLSAWNSNIKLTEDLWRHLKPLRHQRPAVLRKADKQLWKKASSDSVWRHRRPHYSWSRASKGWSQRTSAGILTVQTKLKLIRFTNNWTCAYTSLKFNDDVHEKIKGTPVGSPIPGLLVEAVMQTLEKTGLPRIPSKPYIRYTDDTIIIITSSHTKEI